MKTGIRHLEKNYNTFCSLQGDLQWLLYCNTIHYASCNVHMYCMTWANC